MNQVPELFASRLKHLLDATDEKQVDLARLLNVTEATVSRYLKGRIPDDIRTLITIANHFGVTVDFLIGRTNGQSQAAPARPEPARSRLHALPLIRTTKGADVTPMERIQLDTLPLLGRIRAGLPLFAEEHFVGQIEVPTQLKRRADFALEVSGDSMIGAGLAPGDFVFLAKADRHRASHGNIVAAMVDGEMTLKRYIKRDGRFWLHAENPAYVDIPVDDKVAVQGVYVGRYSEYEGLVEPPLEDMNQDELITKLAEKTGVDPDTLAGLLEVLRKKR